MAANNGIRSTLGDLDTWHEARIEPILEPSLPIIDAHHHLWWRPPERYQLSELLADVGSGHNVRATVFVQCTAMYKSDAPEEFRPVGETEYVNGMAAISASGMFGSQRLCAGIVGYVDLRLRGAAARVLDAHLNAGGGRFRGIRQQAQQDPHVGHLAKSSPPLNLLSDPDFLAGFATLAPRNLSFDAWVFFTQLGEVAALADLFPNTSIILNHLGAPLGIGYYADRREEVFQVWARGIRAIADRPNVSIKLGGLGMPAYGFGFEGLDHPASSDDLALAWTPYVHLCIEAFGTERCMFESNFPVDKKSCSYRTLWNAFKRLSSGASKEEKSALFGGTARRIYRLDDIRLDEL